MKRLFAACLLGLLLCGCTPPPQEEAETFVTTAPTETTAATEPTGFYDPDSQMEASSQGALQVYPLGLNDCYRLDAMGQDLVVFSGSTETTLTKLSGSSLYPAAQITLNTWISPQNPAVQVSEKGLTYFDSAAQQIVFLDVSLKEVSRVSLPPDFQGVPALSADRKHLYYRQDDTIRTINLETGIDKLLKEVSFPDFSILDLHCGDSILACRVTDGYGQDFIIYLSAENGQTLEQSDPVLELYTQDDLFLAVSGQGIRRQILTGQLDQAPLNFLPDDCVCVICPVMDHKGLVTMEDDGQGITLRLYSLEMRCQTALLTLPREMTPNAFLSGGEDSLWLLAESTEHGCQAVFRWDLNKTAAWSQPVSQTRYSRSNPDTRGLEACQERAAQLADSYDISILLWNDALANPPADCTLVSEYRVPILNRCLDILEAALAAYPETMWKEIDDRLTLCLVESITGTGPKAGLLHRTAEHGITIYLAADDTLEAAVYHQLYDVLESRIMSLCAALDDWDSLNPKNFSYTYTESTPVPEAYQAYLDGPERAFVSEISMYSAQEDRATVMACAMLEGMESCFESPIIQRKLAQLCLGIRQAFDLEDVETTFLWEQYLIPKA